jgi:hypothetical protein
MIFLGLARLGVARPGTAWRGNTLPGTATRTIFQGRARRGSARQGPAWHGMTRQNAFRWAVSPDTFGKQQQGNQSKTT